MPLGQWTAFYRVVESERLRHYARMVGVMHPKSPRQAQRDLLRAAARVAGARAGIDLLGDPRRLRAQLERHAAELGVAVETAPPPEEPPDKPEPDSG